MNKYIVTFNCIFSMEVEAENPKEAADIVAAECPLDIDGYGYVEDLKTRQSYHV